MGPVHGANFRREWAVIYGLAAVMRANGQGHEVYQGEALDGSCDSKMLL